MAGDTPVLVHNANGPCGFDKDAENAELPAFDGTTVGRGVSNNGEPLIAPSGIRQTDSKLIDIVNTRLRALGITKAKSGFADHAEQKIAAMMLADDSISTAEIVINHPNGPCGAPVLGCQSGLMNALLGRSKQLTVHWLDSAGEWNNVTWGGPENGTSP